jgi:hypothetical protein
MKKLSRDAYDLKMEFSETAVKAIIKIREGDCAGEYVGEAKYHDGDVKSNELAGKIARSKAWRSYWDACKRASISASRSYEAQMNDAIDKACSYNKKANELNEYIKKLVRGETK